MVGKNSGQNVLGVSNGTLETTQKHRFSVGKRLDLFVWVRLAEVMDDTRG